MLLGVYVHCSDLIGPRLGRKWPITVIVSAVSCSKGEQISVAIVLFCQYYTIPATRSYGQRSYGQESWQSGEAFKRLDAEQAGAQYNSENANANRK